MGFSNRMIEKKKELGAGVPEIWRKWTSSEGLLSFSWNAPPLFPEVRNSSYKTWVVVEFSPAAAGRSEIKLTHLGWPDDNSWLPVYDYFNSAWDRVLESLEKSLD